MTAVFIAYDQAHHEAVVDILDHLSCRGFTAFTGVTGRGSRTGDPHYGSHAWPSLGAAMMTIVEDSRLDQLLSQLHELDVANPLLGLRAFAWPIARTI